jgi:hypothetical protein
MEQSRVAVPAAKASKPKASQLVNLIPSDTLEFKSMFSARALSDGVAVDA